MLLRLKRGTTTYTLSGDGAVFVAATYVPGTPGLDEQEVSSILRDGGDVTALARRNVTEQATVTLEGTSAEILEQVRALEGLFPVEERRIGRYPQRLFVEYRQEDSGTVYRSEILAGRVVWPNRPLWSRLASGTAQVELFWTRRYFWESTVESPIYLAGLGVSRTISGVIIKNAYDPPNSRGNYVDILADDVEGVIPAPIELTMAQNGAGTFEYRRFYVSQFVDWGGRAPADFDPILEGEETTAGAGTTVADSGSSNGNFRRVTWTGSSAHTSVRYRWTLSLVQLYYMASGYFRVLARFAATPPADAWFRLRVGWPTTGILTTMAETDEVTASGRLVDLGVVRLPPITLEHETILSNWLPLALEMSIRAGSSGQVDLDFLQLSPLDGWRKLSTLGYQYSGGHEFVDDGIRGQVYTQDGSDRLPVLVPAGGRPIQVWPGKDQRLYFLHDEVSGMTIGNELKITAAYRARRLTV